jgi:hypothetical protein
MNNKKNNIYHLDLGGRLHLCGKVKGKYLYNLSAFSADKVNCPACLRSIKTILRRAGKVLS